MNPINRTKDEWLTILKQARNTITWEQYIDPFFNNVGRKGWSEDHFITDLIMGLCVDSEEGVNELVKRMNDNPPKDYTPENITKKWNASKSPIRNFLLIRYIDYPTKIELEARKLQESKQ